MQDIFNQIDKFYQANQYEEAYQYILNELRNAIENSQDEIILGLLSELMGYLRVRGDFDLGNQMAIQAKKIIQSLCLENSLAAATTFLNIATLHRVQGLYQESFQEYQNALSIYEQLLLETDERYISLYNNMSLLYQEMNQYDQALEYELKALSLIENKEDCDIETAITYTNLSQMYFSINQRQEGEKCLNQAIALFETYAPNDPHYFATIAVSAQNEYLKNNDHKALELYEKVLDSIEKIYGKNKDYETVYSNYLYIKKQIQSQHFGLSLCENYYQEIGLPMLEERFPDLLKYMAIGLVGMGSECLGYDDKISQDHDFGPGFCIFVPQDIYIKYGSLIQGVYDEMNSTYQGYRRNISVRGDHRVGVFNNEEFYKMYLGKLPMTLKDWLDIDESALLAMTSGKIFRDDFGEFTHLRELLHYYPEDIRVKKIAKAIAKMAQSGQYNYARCMRRYDEVAANLALYEFINATLSCLYLLNKTYKPYYKWVYRGINDLQIGKDIGILIKDLILLETQIKSWDENSPELNYSDKKVEYIEKICQRVIQELHLQNLSTNQDDFLESHVNEVMSHIQDKAIRNMHVMEG